MDFSPGIELGEPDGHLETAFSSLTVEQSLEQAREEGSLRDLAELNRIRVRYATSSQAFCEAYLVDRALITQFPDQLDKRAVTPESVRDYFEGFGYRFAKRDASSSDSEYIDFTNAERTSMTELIRAMLADGEADAASRTFAAASESLDGANGSRCSESRVGFVQRIISGIEPGNVNELSLLGFVEQSLDLLQRYGSDGELTSGTSRARYDLAKDMVAYGCHSNASPAFFERVLVKWETRSMYGGEPLEWFASHVREQVHAATGETANAVLDLIKLLPASAQSFRHEMIDTLGVVLMAQRPTEQQNPA